MPKSPTNSSESTTLPPHPTSKYAATNPIEKTRAHPHLLRTRPYKTKRFFHLFLVSTLWHPYVNEPKMGSRCSENPAAVAPALLRLRHSPRTPRPFGSCATRRYVQQLQPPNCGHSSTHDLPAEVEKSIDAAKVAVFDEVVDDPPHGIRWDAF